MSEQLTITIDGMPCTCEKGEYLYDIARRNDIFIPVLCRSDAFEDHRACCRVCIVEVVEGGRSKVVTSCIYPVSGECEVFTKSDKIREERAVIMSLLAHRAPESERIVQMADKLGAGEGFERFVTLDGEKCILCGLCVQACNGLGTGAISTVMRGTDKMIDTPYNEAPEPCIGCVSCANVCPTGAIEFTENDSTRTIWQREFELVYCERCGEVMGTAEMLDRAASETNTERAVVCDACRKEQLADEMMQTYRYV